ncbi:reverse transcriptase domain-containing protein [Tanacetum coccineum]
MSYRDHTVKLSILNVLPFEEGRLPVKYLGVLLVSSRLMVRDCKELVEKVQSRVQDWKNKSLLLLVISNDRDRLEWRLSDGTVKNFSVTQVWSSIRPRDVKVDWYDMVWFATNIPRHAFNLWLIIKHKLKTQDRVYVWDVSNTLGSTCSLCEAIPDSHEHLFFMCPFSNDVWDHMKKLAGLDRVVHDVYAIIHHIGPKAKRRLVPDQPMHPLR